MSFSSDQETAMTGIEPDPGSLRRDDPKGHLMHNIVLKASKLLRTRDGSYSSKFPLHGLASKDWDDFWDACRDFLMHEGGIVGIESSEILSLLENTESLRNKTEDVQTKHAGHSSLDPKDESLKTLERQIEVKKSELLDKDRRISQLCNDLRESNDRLNEMAGSHESEVFRLKDVLARKEKMIHGLEDQQKTWTVQKAQIARDYRKLHVIVAESAQEIHPYDDQHITKQFTALQGKIDHLVRKHFPATWTKTSWKDYDNIRDTDDRDYFLQAHIATVLAQSFFSPYVRLFGFEREIEQQQANFESLLEEHKVPPPEIANWRIQTIKVSELMASEHPDLRAQEVHERLKEKLRLVHKCCPKPTDWDRAKSALLELCKFASDLALSLRRCRVKYEWLQKASSLCQDDFERIENYNVGGQGPRNEMAEILFGPVYKHVEGVMVKLRDGIMLCD